MAKKKHAGTATANAVRAGVEPEDRLHPCCDKWTAKLEAMRKLNNLLVQRTKENGEEISHLKSDLAGITEDCVILSALERSVSGVVLSSTLSALDKDLTVKGLAEAAAVDRARLMELEFNKFHEDDRARRVSMLALSEEKLTLELRLHVFEKLASDLQKRAEETSRLKDEEMAILSTESAIKVRELETCLAKLGDEMTLLKDAMQTLLDEKKILEGKYSNFKILVKQLERDEEIALIKNGEISSLNRIISENESMIASLKGNCESLKNSHDELAINNSYLTREVVSLREEARRMKSYTTSLQDKLELVEREKKVREDAFESRVKVLADEKVEMQCEMSKKAEDLIAVEIKVAILESTISNLEQSEINRALDELSNEKEMIVKLHTRLQELTNISDAMEVDVTILKETNKSLQVDNEEKVMQYKLLMEEKISIEKNLQCVEMEVRHLDNMIIAGKKFLQRTLSLLKSDPETMMTPLGHVSSENENVEMDEEMQQMLAEFEAIKIDHEKKKQKMEDLSKKKESSNCALAEVKKNKKGFSKWQFLLFATTGFASLLFAFGSKAIK